MLIEYSRSSSINGFSYCEQSYFLTYNLGFQQEPNVKTVKGTATHKVLEWLAIGKKYLQDNPNTKVIEFGDGLTCKTIDFLRPAVLTDAEVDAINKSRTNKSIYKTVQPLLYGATRYGTDVLNDLVEESCNMYAGHTKTPWTRADRRDVGNWSWMAVEYNNGAYDPRRANIECPERQFDLDINCDWAKSGDSQYSIKGTIDSITRIDDKTLEIVDWKGLPTNTPIPTPDGWSTMGDLNIGDMVFDKNGIPTKVLAKSKKSIKPCYKITFDDTTTAICDNEHLWMLDCGKVVSITELKVRDKISVAKPMTLEEKELPIDPYILGYWLGNGRNRNGEICGMDDFVFEEIERRGYTLGKDISSEKSVNCQSRTILSLVSDLRKLNLLHNKHIPTVYLRASYNQRLDLLRGLMDSDGSANTIRKQGVFTNCNKTLSDDVKELLLTLGQRPNQCHTKQNGFGLTVDCYPLHFRPININPFLLPRKANKIDLNWGSGESFRRMVVSIEPIEDMETQCISVDSDTKTYLCTKNMIPTHNTGQRLDWATGEVKTYGKLCTDMQLMLYYYAASRLYPMIENIYITIFFIRDGGPFTICFEPKDKKIMEERLKEHYFKVKNCTLPKMVSPDQSDFRCNRLCTFFRNKWEGSNKNQCRFIHDELHQIGMDKVIDKYKVKNFDAGFYQSPGE